VDHLELRNVECQQPEWPTQDLYVAFKRDIPAALDDKMLAIPQKRRNMVRKALKAGLRAVPDDTVEHFFPVFATNARDHGTPTLPKRYFEQLQTEFGEDCRILSIYTSTHVCISSILCFFHKDEVLAYYAGERPQARGTAANDLKYWEVMKWAQSRGCTRFDLGRSKKGSGSFDFKRLWGFEPMQLHYQYRLFKRETIPQNNPNNPRYRMLIQAWQRLPLPVANTIGPWLVRGLG
jgi:FemAB-related protein (PEP-CTERM system-associated)